MRGRRSIALLLTAALLLLSACGEQEAPDETESQAPAVETQSPQKMEFALCCDPAAALDPLSTSSSLHLALSGLVYEGLFHLDSSFQAQPLLCESWSVSDDGLTWTFLLREDVLFSDGTPLTAAHAAASLNTARSSQRYASRLAEVTAVKAVDDRTLTVHLSTPLAALPARLDIPITLPGDDVAPLGTGPYAYDQSGDGLSLTANTLWWQEETQPLSAIPLRAVSSGSDQVAAFSTGLCSAVVSDPTSTNALVYSGSYETWTCATTSMLYLGFRCSGGWCADPVLRQAVSQAIDRASLCSDLLSGYADPSALPLSPSSALYDADLADALDGSLSQAEELLTAGGYSRSEDGTLLSGRRAVSLTLLVNSENPFRVPIAEAIAQSLSQLGITVTVTALPWSEFTAALARGDFDLYLAQTTLTADCDLSALLTGSLNYGGFSDGAVSALLAAYRAEGSQSAASALFAALGEEVPFAPICFLRSAVLTRWGTVSNVSPTQQNPFFQFCAWTFS